MSQPFSADGDKLFYLVRRGALVLGGAEDRTGEPWMTELGTGRSVPLLRGFRIVGCDIARDSNRIVFAALDERGASHIWLASLEGRTQPRQISSLEADSPRFGVEDIFCRGTNGSSRFIYRINEAGDRIDKAVESPVLFFMSISPDGAWLVARVAAEAGSSSQTNVAFPIAGGAPVPVCDTCDVDWTPDAKSLVLRLSGDRQTARTFVIRLHDEETLPRLPPGGVHSEADLAQLPVTQITDGFVYPDGGESPQYAYSRVTIQRNIYRVPIER